MFNYVVLIVVCVIAYALLSIGENERKSRKVVFESEDELKAYLGKS